MFCMAKTEKATMSLYRFYLTKTVKRKRGEMEDKELLLPGMSICKEHCVPLPLPLGEKRSDVRHM